MATLRIYDLHQRASVIDLRHVLDLLAPRSRQANWAVATVKSSVEEWFEVTGPGGSELEKLLDATTRISREALSRLANEIQQVIWGAFIGYLAVEATEPWVIIRAIDSTFYEITTLDATVLDRVRSAYRDVRSAEAAWS